MSDIVLKKKANAKALAEGYSPAKRALEITVITLFVGCWTTHFVRLSRYYVHDGGNALKDLPVNFALGIVGILLADFFSGLVHWGLDTWGSTETPVFGSFIRSFREHHVDQSAITRHDTIETNGDNCLVCLPALVPMLFVPIDETTLISSPQFRAFLVWLCLAVSFTNQFHKWSHERNPPAYVRLLMKYKLILTSKDHRVHHSGEYDQYYCITTGWLNPVLDAIKFWRGAEWLITKTTGAIPREDDKVTACIQ